MENVNRWMGYKPTGKNEYGEEIQDIYSHSNGFCVYTVKGEDGIRYEYDMNFCPNAQKAIFFYRVNKMRLESIKSNRKRKMIDKIVLADFI